MVRAGGVLLLTDTRPRQFLLMRHPDRWDLPKGHCDGGETFLQAAKRELQEETGISPSRCRFADDFHFDLTYPVTYRGESKSRQKKIRYFLAFVPETVRITVTEHESYRWWPWNPPHQIQHRTVDPLLASVATYLQSKGA